MVRLVVISACNGGNIGTLGNQLGSVAQALHQIGIGAVIASRFPLSIPGSIEFTRAFYRGLFGGPSSVESAFLAARRQLARDTSRLDWASMQLYACGAEGHDNRPIVLRPYRGLLAFQPEHSRFFFGRDAEIQELIDDLGALAKAGAPRFLVIAGSSGTGKSSVVLAGAVPRMLQQPGATWVFARMRPGPQPLAALDAALATRAEPDRPLLLVVDQFEELFTQTESVEERDAFARRLWELAAAASSGVSVLVTLRVDFIGRGGELVLDDKGLRLDKVAYEEKHRVFVAQMTQAQLEEAICKPAQLVGLTLEAGLARRMLQDVEGEPGALPLLQDTLDMLWQQREGRSLTQAAYDGLGGVSGALSQRADARIAALEPMERVIARRLFLGLVSVHSDTAMDTRRRALLTEVRPRDPEQGVHFDRVLDRFVDERLLVRMGDGQATTVEVAHEALIRNWRKLREWVDEDRGKLLARQALARKVEEWKQNGALLNEQQLGLAEAAAQDVFEEPGDDAKQLLEASRAEVRRKRRLKQSAVAGLAAAAVVSAVLGVWGQKQAATARAQRQQAELQARHARDIGRVSAARRVESEPDVALTLLREAEAEDPGHVQDWLETALYFVSSPVVHNRTPVELKGHQGPVDSASFSADGKRMVTLSRDGSARVWNEDGTPAGPPLQVEGAKIGAAGFSPDGTRLVTGWTDGTVRVWTVEGAPVGKPFEGHDAPVSSASFSPDGKRIFTASEDGNARVWTAEGRPLSSLPGAGAGLKGQEDLRVQVTFSADGTRVITLSNGTARLWRADGTPICILEGTGGKLLSAAFSADGTRILTLSSTRTRIWTDTGVLLSELPGFGHTLSAAALNADGKRVVTASRDGVAWIWQVDESHATTLVAMLKGDAGDVGAITSTSFSPDSAYVVTASSDRTARVWWADGALLAELTGHGGPVNSAAFSPDGTHLITASEDGTARVWTADGSFITRFKTRSGPRPLVRQRMTVVSAGGPLRPLPPAGASAVFSANGARVLTTSDGSAWMWKADGTSRIELEGHQGQVTSAAFSDDGMHVVTASDDGNARVWKVDGERVAEVPSAELPHGRKVSSASFSADGSRVVTVLDSMAQVWRLDNKARIASFENQGKVLSAVLGPTGLRVVVADGPYVSVWTADGTLVTRLEGPRSPVHLATFSADGTQLVTASEDGSAWVWKADGTLVAQLVDPRGHHVKIHSAAFSRDGTYVVTGTEDQAVRLWRSDGTLVLVLNVRGGPVRSVAFSPDGTHLLTASDTLSRKWCIHPPDIRRALWLSTRFCLGSKERMSLLGETESIARAGYTNCADMLLCLDNGGTAEPARYERCLAAFRKSEAARFRQGQ